MIRDEGHDQEVRGAHTPHSGQEAGIEATAVVQARYVVNRAHLLYQVVDLYCEETVLSVPQQEVSCSSLHAA